jgi:hypothetical protein
MIGPNAVILMRQTASVREVADPLTGIKTKLQAQIQSAQITLLGIDTTRFRLPIMIAHRVYEVIGQVTDLIPSASGEQSLTQQWCTDKPSWLARREGC